MKSRLRSTRGFSLIEMMVVAGIAAIILYFATLSFRAILQSSQFNEDKFSKTLLSQSIHNLMSDYDACSNTLSGLTLGAPDSVLPNVVIKDDANHPVYAANSESEVFEGLRIKSIGVKNIDLTIGDPSGRVEFIFDVERQQKGGGTSSLKMPKIERRVLVAPGTTTVTACANVHDDSLLIQKEASATVPIADFSELEIFGFTVDRLKTQSQINVSLHIGGTDVVWGHIRVYRGTTQIANWTDGTSHIVGAAIHSAHSFVDQSVDSGPTSYRITFERISHPTYGTAPAHVHNIHVVYRQ